MTALDRALGWFIAPADPKPYVAPTTARRPGDVPFAAPAIAPRHGESPRAAPAVAPVRRTKRSRRPRPAHATATHGEPSFAEPMPSLGQPPRGALAMPSRPAEPLLAAPVPSLGEPPRGAPAMAQRLAGSSLAAAGPGVSLDAASPVEASWAVSGGSVVSAAVLGRPNEVEPVAAALALALRRDTRAKVATVVLVGGGLVETGGGGGPAARRVVARLEAQGLAARVRGRLVWVRLDPGDPQLLAWIRGVMYVGAPAVLAVAAPRSAATDEALAEQDLVVMVTGDPDGPLARSAAVGLTGVPMVPAAPLPRGPARALARAGLRATAGMRRLVQPERGR